jgi:hypothetical protein
MIHIPIPEGLELPENAESEPFIAEVEFVLMDGMLMPLSVAGIPLPESGAGDEGEDMGDMEQDAGFMDAIEQAMGGM